MFMVTAALFNTSYAAPGDLVDVAAGNEDFETLVAAVKAAGLVETLQGKGPFTVFAPTDDAFAALPEGTVERLLKPENKDELVAVLTYHVVPGKVMAADVKPGAVASVQGDTLDLTVDGSTVRVDAATVVKTDIAATNGVIHVIDAVVLPQMDEKAPAPATKSNTLVDVAAEAGSFETLIAAAKAAGLAETLAGDGPYTVFAPTDEAFAALGGTVEELLKPENKAQLAAILSYHVVKGTVLASDLSSGKVPTVEGSDLKVKVKKGAVTLNKKVAVVTADVKADNGVIHVIDGVLMP